MKRGNLGCIAFIFFASVALAQTGSRTIHGTVRDQLGYVVVGAHITVQGAGYERASTTARDGSFRVEGTPLQDLQVAVDAPGFAHFAVTLPAKSEQLDIVLKPASVAQTLNVTANRVGTIQAETPESVSVLSRSELDTSAAEAVDQVR